MKQPEETIGRRSRRRPANAEPSHVVFDRTRPYRHLRNPFEPMKVFSDDQVAAIHEGALVMLETQGMKVLSEDARVLYRNAGADVDEATLHVRLGRQLVTASLA
ncbi:MAG TPA: trimethylamine methyltransferase family protein, partial [Steroidobacteraceae bacterium]|nr:trimethylamine methyltransferase family protein [Steroidobacteraceae bacterium]